MFVRLCIIASIFLCSQSQATKKTREELFRHALMEMGLTFNEDVYIPLRSTDDTLKTAQQTLAVMKTSSHNFATDSYEYAYIQTLIIGQNAIITYIQHDLRKQQK